MIITIKRKGSFPVGWTHSHDHQCGQKGTSILHFKVEIQAKHIDLNPNGWIIDNNDIVRYFEEKYKHVKDFLSCEHISMQACRDLYQIIRDGGARARHIAVSTTGISGSWITAEDDFLA